jgi:hypothetical protein
VPCAAHDAVRQADQTLIPPAAPGGRHRAAGAPPPRRTAWSPPTRVSRLAVNRSSRSPDQPCTTGARRCPAISQAGRAGHARSEPSARTMARSPASRPAVAWPCAPGALPTRIPRIRAAMTLISPTSTAAPVHDSRRRSPDVNWRFVTDRDSWTVARHAISVRSVRLWRGAFGLLRQCIKVDLRAPAGRCKDGPVGQDRVVVGPDRGSSCSARRGSNEPGCHLPRLGHAGTLAGSQAGGWR